MLAETRPMHKKRWGTECFMQWRFIERIPNVLNMSLYIYLSIASTDVDGLWSSRSVFMLLQEHPPYSSKLG